MLICNKRKKYTRQKKKKTIALLFFTTNCQLRSSNGGSHTIRRQTRIISRVGIRYLLKNQHRSKRIHLRNSYVWQRLKRLTVFLPLECDWLVSFLDEARRLSSHTGSGLGGKGNWCQPRGNCNFNVKSTSLLTNKSTL